MKNTVEKNMEKEYVFAGETLRLENGERWIFVTDSFYEYNRTYRQNSKTCTDTLYEYVSHLRVLRVYDRAYQNNDYNNLNSTGAKDMLDKANNDLHKELLPIEKELLRLENISTSNVTDEIKEIVKKQIADSKIVDIEKARENLSNEDETENSSQKQRLIKTLTDASKEFLTVEGVRGCEKFVLDDMVKNETRFLGSLFNAKTIYILKRNSKGQAVESQEASSAKHKFVVSAWVTMDQIEFNFETNEWRIKRVK